jgi:hypothetical protein
MSKHLRNNWQWYVAIICIIVLAAIMGALTA